MIWVFAILAVIIVVMTGAKILNHFSLTNILISLSAVCVTATAFYCWYKWKKEFKKYQELEEEYAEYKPKEYK